MPEGVLGGTFGGEGVKLPGGKQTKNGDLYLVTPNGFSRWGLYEKDALFMVWDAADRKRFAQWLLNPEEAVNQMNDDNPHAIIEME